MRVETKGGRVLRRPSPLKQTFRAWAIRLQDKKTCVQPRREPHALMGRYFVDPSKVHYAMHGCRLLMFKTRNEARKFCGEKHCDYTRYTPTPIIVNVSEE